MTDIKPFKITAWVDGCRGTKTVTGPLKPSDLASHVFGNPGFEAGSDVANESGRKGSLTRHRRYGFKSRFVEDGE